MGKAVLLAGNYLYEGSVVGYLEEPVGFELCFNTSMTGYQEIMTDPSYLGQVIVFTFPHIGNVGCNSVDIESDGNVRGIVVRELPTKNSSWRAEIDFEAWLLKHKIFCFYGVDTRNLVEKIRKKEVGTGILGRLRDIDTVLKMSQSAYDTEGQDLGSLACGDKIIKMQQNGKKVAVIDCGIKQNILNCLYRQGFDLTVYPCKLVKDYVDEIKNSDGLFISNGPGDPRATLKNTMDLKDITEYFVQKDKPIFGICLGHQILSLIFGIEVNRMPQGHRGANQPVLNTQTGKVHISSQNHGFAALRSNLATEKYVSLLDNVIEGFTFHDKKIISVQYHPESSPGPRDSRYIFEEFKRLF